MENCAQEKKPGMVNNPELPTTAKKTATLQPNTKIQNPCNDAYPVGRFPIAVSLTLKYPNLTDKDLMDICAQ